MGVSFSIDRVSTDDLMSLATERGASPLQVGAVLIIDTADVLGTGTGLDVERAVDLLAQRLPGVPRLRQRLVPAPFGCGRPIWADDADFDVTQHVSVVPCPAPGGEQAVLDLAAVLLVTPLPRTRALWAATLVTGVARHQAALIVVFHHVLADGVAGLVVLGGLVDQSDATGTPRAVGPKTRESDFPRPQASIRQLAIGAWTRRLGSLRALPALLRRLLDAARELRSVRWTRLRSTSLNRPTGPRRSLATVTVALDEIRNAGNAQKATVNDVVLTAIGGALHRLLALRDEAVDRFIVSVPFSWRRATTHGDLGNRSGVIPIRVPGVGAAESRLRFVAEGTRKAKRSSPGATTALLGPFFPGARAAGTIPMVRRPAASNPHLCKQFARARTATLNLWLPGHRDCPAERRDGKRDRLIHCALIRRRSHDHSHRRPRCLPRLGHAAGSARRGASRARQVSLSPSSISAKRGGYCTLPGERSYAELSCHWPRPCTKVLLRQFGKVASGPLPGNVPTRPPRMRRSIATSRPSPRNKFLGRHSALEAGHVGKKLLRARVVPSTNNVVPDDLHDANGRPGESGQHLMGFNPRRTPSGYGARESSIGRVSVARSWPTRNKAPQTAYPISSTPGLGNR